jgi:hypothetical protein
MTRLRHEKVPSAGFLASTSFGTLVVEYDRLEAEVALAKARAQGE